MRTILASLLFIITITTYGQKKELLEDKDVILARAAQAMDELLLPGSKVHEAILKEGLWGRYVLQVSFREKGDISSVFVVAMEDGDIRSQNRFKDLVHLSSMPFKMPKGRQYRIEHTFDLTALRQ